MKRLLESSIIGLMIASGLLLQSGVAATREEAVVQTAREVLGQIVSIPESGIPPAMLKGAQGIAIIPNLIKGGFIVGGRHGRGVVCIRDAAGSWSPPIFMSLTGGSVGFQAGLQSTDLILVFKTKQSLNRILGGQGKLTLGADAGVAAGPVGRQIAVGTDSELKAEIFSYSRSRGLFAGVSLDGSVLEVDAPANWAFYAKYGATPGEILAGGAGQIPAVAIGLQTRLNTLAPPTNLSEMVAANGTLGMQPPPALSSETVRRQLASASRQLAAQVDRRWQEYLALPAEVYDVGNPVNVELLGKTLERFDAITKDPRYKIVAEIPEFQTTHHLLGQYLTARSAEQRIPQQTKRVLPPPPGMENGVY